MGRRGRSHANVSTSLQVQPPVGDASLREVQTRLTCQLLVDVPTGEPRAVLETEQLLGPADSADSHGVAWRRRTHAEAAADADRTAGRHVAAKIRGQAGGGQKRLR